VPTSAATEIPSIANPISPENMDLLTRAGYQWDEQTGELTMANGYVALTLIDGKWLDTRTGAETPPEALRPVAVNGVDFQGKEIGAVLTREVNGETQIYLPTIDAWVTPLEVPASQNVIDRPDLPKADRLKLRDPKDIVIENIPVMTWDDFHSGRLFYSELLALKEWPENVRVPNLVYRQMTMITNVWTITEYSDIEEGMVPGEGQRPILAENDGVMNLDAFRMQDPITGTWTIMKGQQYLYNGKNIVLHMFFTDELADSKSNEIGLVQLSLSNPSMRITEPIVNIRPEDWCGRGGLGYEIAQPGICALQGYDHLDLPRDVLPESLQKKIAEYDVIEGQLTIADFTDETWPVGDEIARLQALPLPQNSFFQHQMEYYLLPEDSELLKP
jgi:hypothetical protein